MEKMSFFDILCNKLSFNSNYTRANKEGISSKGILVVLLALILSVSAVVGFAAYNADSVAYASSDVAAVTFNEETTYYTSLVDALVYANAQSSSAGLRTEVKLLDDVVLAAYLEVKAEKFITLNLNGFTLDRGLTTATANGAVIVNKGNLIIKGSSADGNGVITGGYNSNSPLNDYAGGGISCQKNSQLTLKGGNISGNKSLYGGGIGIKEGVFILEGGKVEDNDVYTQGSGGGVYVQDSTLAITGGEIVGNTAKSGGGGVMLIKSAATMSGGEIRGNYSEGNYGGGGVYINTSGFKMTGGTISLNSTISNGGGIYQYTATPIGDLVLAGGAITNNTCATGKSGGGVFVSVNLHITGDMIVTNNVAGGTIENGVLSGGTPYNIHLGSVAVKIGYNDGVITSNNFTGKVGIYSNNYEVNKTFGTVIEGAIITGEITNDRNAQLTGYKQGANCAWDNPAVVRIKQTNSYYSSITRAYTDLSSGQTIELLTNITLASPTSWAKSFTLTSAEGGPYTISPVSRDTTAIFQYITSGANVTIENIIFDGLRDENKVTVASCAFYLKENSTLNIKDGAVIQNFHISTTGVAVYIETGTLNMSGGEISHNCITNTNGIIYGNSASINVNITGGVIKDNKIFVKTDTGAIHLNHSGAKLYIGGSAQIYDNYYQAATPIAKDVYLPSNIYINQTSNFSGKVYVYAVDTYTEGAKFGNNPEGYTGANNFINSRDPALVGRSDGANLVWGNAVAIKRAEKKAEILSYYSEDDYSTINWAELGSIIDNALAELLTIEDVHNFEIASLAAELGEVAVWTQDDIDNAGIEVRSALEQYYQDKCSEILGETTPKDIEDIIQAAISSITSKNYDDATILGDIILYGKIAIAKEVQYFVLDALPQEYDSNLYNTTNWNKLVGYTTAAKTTIAGYSDLPTIENFDIGAVRTNCNSVLATMVVRIGDNYYESLSTACTATVNGDIIYLLKDITLTSSVTLNVAKSVTLTSDGDAAYTITRGGTGNVFVLSNQAELTVSNIKFDGANSSGSAYRLFNITSATLNILGGTSINNFKTTSYAPVIYMSDGVLNMYDGRISDNNSTSTTVSQGASVIYASGNAVLNFYGGEITYNTNGTTSNGIAYLSTTATVKIGGDMQIHSNTNKNGGKDLVISNLPLNVTEDFIGKTIVDTNKNTVGTVFGTATEDADITGEIINEKYIYLFGIKDGQDLIWGYRYNDTPAEVSVKPTVYATGVLLRHRIPDNVAMPITLPMLNTEDYSVVTEDFAMENGKVIYTLKDTTHGTIVIDYDLPESNDASYNKLVNIAPSFTTAGEAYITNTSYPGFEATLPLPVLTKDNYIAIYENNTISYQPIDTSYGTCKFSIDSDYEDVKIAKMQELFAGYPQENYSTNNWITVAAIVSLIGEDVCWLNDSEDLASYMLDNDIIAQLAIIPTVEDRKNEVKDQLENYYKNYIGSEDIPKIIDETIQEALGLINSANCDDSAAIESIISGGKIDIAKEIKYVQLDDLLAEYNPKLYNATNWNKLVGYITAAKTAIAGYTNLATIENYNLTTVRTNCNNVATNMVARIGDDYYETVNAAVASVAEGGTETIYIIKSIDVSPSSTSTVFLEINGNRNITLRTDLSTVPQGKTVHVMKRDNNGSFFTINDGCFLTLADIEIDGNNYKTLTATNYSQSIFYVNTGGTVTIEDNTFIHKCGSQCGYTVASVYGTFIMNGGSISDNKNNTAIPAIDGSGYFYLNGGEIINNQPGSASYGAVNISSAKSINISGGMVITNNTSVTARNLNVGSKPVNVTGNFTGYVSVYADNYTLGATFGTVAEGVVITGTIINARNTKLVGANQGGNLIWDYAYDNSRTAVTTKPTVSTKGVVTRYTVDNVARTSDIPMLNTDDYFVEWDNFFDAAPQITYTLKDTFLGNIVIHYSLPSKDDISYDKVVNIAPDATTAGEATITNANYPGFEATIVIPALTSENYTVIYDTDAGKIIYQLKDGTYGDILFDLSDSELEIAKLAKMQELFAKYEQSNYGSDSWQEIKGIISNALEDICWLDNLSELESYTIDSDTKQQLDGILTISSVKDNVTEQLENYYKAQTGLQDIPEAVQNIIAQAAANINAENYNDTTIVDSIILDGKIAIAKYIKVAQLQEYRQGLISSHYTTANWNTVQSKINNAISAINAIGNLADIETYDILTVMDECDALHLVGFIARVGENYYTTFANAYTAVANGGTIYLISNIALTPQATTITKSITITSEEGSIYKISSGDYTKQGALLKINNATVTIRNIEMDGGKTLNTTSGATSPARVQTARAIHIENNATLNIQGGTLIHNFHGTSSHGGAIYITGATLNMYGGEISNNSIMGSSYHGSAIYGESGATISLSGGKIADNYGFGNSSTGAVYTTNLATSKVNLSGDIVFEDNWLYSLSGSTYSKVDRKDIVLETNVFINLVGDFTGFVRVYKNGSNSAGNKIGNNPDKYSGVEYIVNTTATLIGSLSGNNIIWKAFSKDIAKDMLDAYVGDYPTEDVLNLVNAAKDSIDDTTGNFDAISSILKGAYAQIDVIHSQELAGAKDTVWAELEQYYQDELSGIFGQQMASEVLDIISGKLDQIDKYNYNNPTAIAAIVQAGKQEMYTHYLQQVKDEKLTELDTAITDLVLDESDYTGQNWQAIQDIIADAQAAIGGISSITDVLAYDIFAVTYDILDIQTIAQTAAALAAAITEKLAELDTAITDLALDEGDYTADNWQAIQDIITNTQAVIANSDNKAAVEAYDIAVVIASIGNIKTISEQLADAKAAKVAELDSYLEGLTQSDYSADNWQAIQNAISSEKAIIYGYEYIEDVNNYDKTAVIDAICAIETIAQTTARELREAKDAALASIAAAMVDNEEFAAIGSKYEDIIEAAVNINMIVGIMDAFANELNNARLIGKKADIKDALIACHDNMLGDFSPKNIDLVIDIIDAYVAQVTMDNYDNSTEIEAITSQAQNAIFNLYKDLLQDLYTSNMTGYYNNLSSAVTSKEGAINHYNNALQQLGELEDLSVFENTYRALIAGFIQYFDSIYVSSISGEGDDSYDGTYGAPFASLEKAIEMASDGAIIMLQRTYTVAANITIPAGKHITIMTADKLIDGTTPSGYTTVNINKDRCITVLGGLTLQNIIINGYNSTKEPAFKLKGTDASNLAKFVMLDGTTIQNAFRTGVSNAGGSVFLAEFGEFYMYGGEIISCENNGAALLGAVNSSEVDGNIVNYYLLGGTIKNNYAGFINPNHTAVNKVVIGGGFTVVGNKDYGKTTEIGLSLPNAQEYWEIREDFVGNVVFNTVGNPAGNAIKLRLTNASGIVIDGKDLFNVHPAGYPQLYARYNTAEDCYYWDYHYNSEYVVTTAPTFESSGVIANKAIGADVYGNAIAIPALSAIDYDILISDSLVYFSRNDDNYGYIIRSVSTEDYLSYLIANALAEFADFVTDKHLDEGAYDLLIDSLKDMISATDNVFDVEDSLALAKDTLNSGIATDEIIQILTAYNEDNYGADELAAIMDIIMLEAGKITPNNYLTEKDNVIQQGKLAIDNYYLAKAKANAKDILDAYFANLDNPSEAVEDIVAASKDVIDAATTIESLFDIIFDAEAAIDAQYLADNKSAAKAALDTYLGTLDTPSEALEGIIADAKDDIDALTSIDGIAGIIANAIAAADVQHLADKKAEAVAELDTYLAAVNNPSETIIDIIADGKADIEGAVSLEGIASVVANTKAIADVQYLADKRTDKKSELDNMVAGLGLNTEDYTEANWQDILDIIADAKADIDGLTNTIAVADYDLYDVIGNINDIETKAQTAARELTEAKDDKKAELDNAAADLGLNEEAYSAANWQEILDIIADAKAEVDGLPNIAAVTAYDFDSIIDSISDVETKAQISVRELAEAKVDKKADLVNAVAGLGLNTEDYTEANWQDILDIIADAKADIDGLSDITAVADYDLYDVIGNINDIETKAQTAARELAEAKDDKKAELDNAVADLGLNEEDYSAANWQDILDIIADAKAEIDGLSDMAGVIEFDFGNIIDSISGVETKAQTSVRELAEAKVDKKTELDNAVAELGLDAEDYTEANWQDILDIIADAKADIDGLSDITAVTEFDLDSAIDSINGIETKEQTAARELTEAKDDKKAELDNAVADLGLNEEDYSAANWQDILDIIADAKAEIDGLSDMAGVTAFDFDSIIDSISGVETKAQTSVRELAQAKTDKIAQLDTYLDSLEDDDYTPSNWQDILDIIADAKAEIDGLSDIAAVTEFDAQSVIDAADVIETIAETEGKQLENVKVKKKAELTNYVSAEDSDIVSGILADALADIDNATDVDEVNAIFAKAKKDIDDQRLAEAVLLAKEDLRVYLTNYIKDVSIPLTHLTEIIDNAVDNVNKDNYGDIAAIKASAESDLLLQEKAFGKELLDDYFGNLSEENQDLVAVTINTAKAVIDNQQDIAKIRDTANAAMLDSERIIAKSDLDAAKERAKLVLEDYINEQFDGLLDSYIDEYKGLIDSADAIDAVLALLDEAVGTLEGLEDIANLGKDLFGEPLEGEYRELISDVLNNIIDISKDDTLLDGLNAVLDVYKDEKKQEIDSWIAALDEPSAAVIAIASAAKAEIDSIDATIADPKSAIDNLINTAKDNADTQQAADLEALYNQLKAKYNRYSIQDKYQYNDKELTALADIFNGAKDKKDAETITKQDIVDALRALDTVKIKTTASDVRPNNNDDTPLKKDEAYGILESDAILDKGTKLVVEVKVEIVEVEVIKTRIDTANLTHKFGLLGSADLKKELQHQEIYGLLDIYLVDEAGNRINAESGKSYKITILIPEELRNRTGIRIVYKTEDTLEVFDVTREGNWLIFETDHLSNFYLIGDRVTQEAVGTLNLWWLIILLSVIALIELAVIIWKIYDRRKERNENNTAVSALIPMLGASTIIIPNKAILVIIILAIVVVIESVIIALLFIRAKRNPKKPIPAETTKEPLANEQTEQEQPEKVDIEKVDTEKINTEKVDTEKIDIEKVDTEKADIEKSDTKKVDIEKAQAEQEQSEIAQAEQEQSEIAQAESEQVEKTQAAKTDETVVADIAVMETVSEEPLKDTLVAVTESQPRESMGATKAEAAPKDIITPRGIYDYSYKARLHLADEIVLERYAQLKNHILSYEGVSVSKSWGYERFMYRGKSVLKIRANVKSLNVFFNLNASDYEGTKYRLEDVSSTKTHQTTPSKYMVDGPRKLTYAKDLVDQYMLAHNGTTNPNFTPNHYDIPNLSVEELVKMELIKVDIINKTYEDIIYTGVISNVEV